MSHAHVASIMFFSLYTFLCVIFKLGEMLGISVLANKFVLSETLSLSIPDSVRQCLPDTVQHLLYLAAHPRVQSV